MRGGVRNLLDRLDAAGIKPPAAVAITVASFLVVLAVVVLLTPLRCGPARALGLSGLTSNCTATGSLVAASLPTPHPGIPTPVQSGVGATPGKFPPVQAPASGAYPPYSNPASGSYSPYSYPPSGAYPPQSGPASAAWQPFYAPISGSGTGPANYELNCRLPVYAGPPGSGGFVVFPGGTFIADPTSNVTLPSPSPGESPPPGPGGYYGYPGLSYDQAQMRWLPVPIQQVSPDGSHYAYRPIGNGAGLYLVQASSSTQVEVGEGQVWTIAGVRNDGVYASDQNAGGLWFFSYAGSSRKITSSGYWQVADSTAAYGTATSAVPSGAANAIIRLDIASGKTSDWFSRSGAQSSVTGLDRNGNAIVTVQYQNGNGSDIWLVTGPTSATAIAGFVGGPYLAYGFQSNGSPVADSHGIWFAGNWSPGYGQAGSSGVALYVPGSGVYWMSSIGGQLAGGCI